MVKYIIFFLCVLTLESQANMHRRARHFNARDAGATLVLDSRFITGLADGDPVSTWSDRSGNGYDATGSGSARPTFEANEQGGCPTVRFDGSNDTLLSSLNSALIFTGDLTFITLLKRKGSRTFPVAFGFSVFDVGEGRGIFLFSSDSYKLSYGQSGADVKSSFVVNIDTAVIGTALRSGSNCTVFANSQNVGTGTPTTSPVTVNYFAVGSSGISSNFFEGDISYGVAFNRALLPPLRRRLEHAAALSFKISCN
jgi:hypothetical protein